jgi:NAD+ diphosphatase
VIAGFPIARPLLSADGVDRFEPLRDPSRLDRAWADGRVVTLDGADRVATIQTDGTVGPAWTATTGDAPAAGAVLLGSVDGVDHWAVTGPVDRGTGFRGLATLVPATDVALLTTAVAVLGWHRRSGFCSRCGLASEPEPSGWSRTCPNGHQEWPRTDPAVIVLVHDGADRMLLARQPGWPAGRHSVLAGFTEAGESLEGTVRREIREEVGLHVDQIGYLGSQPWPFPRSLMIGFAARADPDAPIAPADGEIESAGWYHRDDLARLLAAGGRAADLPVAERGRMPVDFAVPDEVSIARRMIEGWVALGSR